MKKIVLWDIVIFINSYKVVYFFHDLSSILKGLHIWLKNKHFITQKNLKEIYDKVHNRSIGTLFLVVVPIILEIQLWKVSDFFLILWDYFLETTGSTIKNEVSS